MIKELLVYLQIRTKIKIQKIMKKDFIKNYEESNKIIKIERIKDLYLVTKFRGMQLCIEKRELKNVNIIKAIVKCFKEKEIEIYEKEKVLSNEDIREIAKISRNVYLNSKYMERRNTRAINEVFKCDITTYLMILDKIDFLIKYCNTHFEREEEKVVFIITQLGKYIKYVNYHDYRTCMANSILLKTGVCVDFAITLYKCMEDLGIECLLVNGISKGNKNDIGSKVNIFAKSNHTWNQVKVNNIWYNFDITWFFSENKSEWIFATDEEFTKDFCHISEQQNHICNQVFSNKRKQELIEKISKYESVLDKFDKGIKNVD